MCNSKTVTRNNSSVYLFKLWQTRQTTRAVSDMRDNSSKWETERKERGREKDRKNLLRIPFPDKQSSIQLSKSKEELANNVWCFIMCVFSKRGSAADPDKRGGGALILLFSLSGLHCPKSHITLWRRLYLSLTALFLPLSSTPPPWSTRSERCF